jgi:hypothetical protein
VIVHVDDACARRPDLSPPEETRSSIATDFDETSSKLPVSSGIARAVAISLPWVVQ